MVISEDEPQSETYAFDATYLASGWTVDFAVDETIKLWERGDQAGGGVLLLAGTAKLTIETPLGTYKLCTLAAPYLAGVAELLMIGSRRLHGLTIGPKAAYVRMPASEIRQGLLSELLPGACSRRIALASLARTIRRTNAGLNRFFADMEKGPEGKRVAASSQASKPADLNRASNLLNELGLDVRMLPNLGLEERTYPAGERIASAGEEAHEAFLIQSGSIMVSVQIPGAGTEALGICGPGEFVGEMSLVDLSVRSADLSAHEKPATVYVLSREVFRRLLDEPPLGCAPLVAGIGTALALRFEQALERSASFYVMSGGFGGPQELPPEIEGEDDPNAIDLLGSEPPPEEDDGFGF